MNARAYQILNDLSNYEDNTILDLSEKYNVSMRTIRNDINTINKFLEDNYLDKIIISGSGKIVLDLEENTLKNLLANIDFYDYKLSHEERKALISYILLMNKRPTKVQDLASILSVSRATINNDLEELKNDFLEYDLKIRAFSNKGLHVLGNEINKRDLLINLKYSDLLLLDSLITHIDNEFFKLDDFFTVYNRNIIIKLLNQQLSNYGLKFTENNFNYLVDYCELLIKRNKWGFYVESGEKAKEVNEFAQSTYLLLTQYFEIEINTNEETTLSDFFNKVPFIEQKEQDKYFIQVQLYTRNFITKISSSLNINLSDDYEFYENLSSHLNSIQSQDDLTLELNPFISEIVQNNLDILEAVKSNISEYEGFIGRELSEIELYYIVIHICAALERKKNKNLNFDVILICNAGIGTTKLLQERLKKHFNFQHITIQTANTPINNQPNTIVLSTIQLNQIGTNYIKISPLLNDEDLIKIGRRIEIIHSELPEIQDSPIKTTSSSSQLIKQINKLILAEEDIYKKLDEVDSLLTNYFDLPSSGNPRLCELITAKFIKLDQNFSTLESAIESAGDILFNQGIIDRDYIKACIKAVQNFGPYMFIGETFFLPHSNVSEGNKNVGFSLIRLEKPLILSNGKTIKWISMMSAIDREKHLKALFTLGNLVQDQEYMLLLEKAKTPKEIEKIIRDYEYLKHPVSAY